MNVLFLTGRFPFPPYKGDQVVSYRRMQYLSETHKIFLLTFYENEKELEGIPQLEKFCEQVYCVKLPQWQSWLNLLRGLYRLDTPLQVLYYRSGQFKRTLDEILRKHQIDVIHTIYLRMSQYSKDLGDDYTKVLDLVDSMQLNLERRLKFENTFLKFGVREELRRIKGSETQIGKYFDHMILVANKDREYLADEHVSVIPVCIALDEFFPPPHREQKAPLIVFSGNMGYWPNVHAVTWFADNCFPLVREKVPDAVFAIVGKDPAPAVKNLAQREGIKVTGFVESVQAYLGEAAMAIAPMQSGSGMQNKILEAMACGLPVVTTTLGLGSIEAAAGEEILVADTAAGFAREVVAIVNNPERAAEIGRRARKCIEQRYDWRKAASVVADIYERIRRSKPTCAGR